MKKIHLLIATFGYTGLFPIAPGTLASLITTVVVFFISRPCGHLGCYSLLLASFIVYLVGIKSSNVAEKHYNKKDPGFVVIDEVAGQLIPLAIAPLNWIYYLVAFLLFRFFDIIKPYPVSWADKKMKGGLGIMTDDIFAGIYSLLTLKLLMIIFVDKSLSI